MIARLIGERSAGMTAVEIYNGDILVWSHMYFAGGATERGYIQGLCQVYDDMIRCADIGQYEGCDYDEDGAVVQYDDADTTGIILEYDSSTQSWTMGSRYGQSDEILDALMLLGIIAADADHIDYERAHGAVVDAIATHIASN